MSKLPVDSGNKKPQLNQEQLAQLLQQMSEQKPLTPGQQRMQKILSIMLQKFQKLLQNLDKFINFITKKHGDNRNDVLQNARSPIVFGVYVIIIFVFFGGIWMSFAPLNSAAVASGILITSTNKQIIQSRDGGIIKKIFVQQGDSVKAGDPLVELDATQIMAKYESALSAYRLQLATESRLIAERDNLDHVDFPEFLLQDRESQNVSKLLNTQENLLHAKRDIIKAKKELSQQKIAQLNKKIQGLEAQKLSLLKNLNIIKDRTKGVRTLHSKGFAQKNALLDYEAKEAELQSNLELVNIQISQSEQDITSEGISLIQSESDDMRRIFEELKQTENDVVRTKQEFISSKEMLDRVLLRSPVDGVVNAKFVHTIGGVVHSTTPILEISPVHDQLIIEAKVPQKNIDAVHVGLVAKIRFSAFKSRTTPTFTGKVVALSHDIVKKDENGQQIAVQGVNPMQSDSAYIARIEIDMDEFDAIAKGRKLKLQPGMSAEVQIITGTRTLLRYLLDPVTDTMFKSFKEK